MDLFLIVVAALGVGLAVGIALAQRRRSPDPSLVQEGWLEAHAAELRRLGDAARARDGAEDRLRGEVQAARQAVEALRIRDEEPRQAEAQHAEVVRRLAS